MTRRRWGALMALVALAAVAALLLHGCQQEPTTVTAVAVGDMACDPLDPQFNDGLGTELGCQQQAASEMAVALQPDALLGLGDYQYEVPDAASYRTVYHDSWGRLRDVTIPAIGNQEYKVHQANTFRDYFGSRSGSETGYWATDLGQWRVIVLNSNCTTVVGGCAVGSPQWEWLAQELRDNPARCTVALWHHPRWSNGIAGADARTADLVELMASSGVDLGLAAHESDYERFRPMDGAGRPDDAGIRAFVVGTGGQSTYQPDEGNASWRQRQTSAGSEFFTGEHHGFLELELSPDRYAWRFHALGAGADGGSAVLDAGEGVCT